jgi:foldase protein PrsA
MCLHWRSRSWLLLLTAFLAACGGSGSPKQVPANAVALVGDQPITRASLASMLAANPQSGRNRALDQLVQDAELEQRAKSQFGIVIGDGQVDRQVQQLRTRMAAGSEARFRAALAQQGLTVAQLRARIRQQLLGEAVAPWLSAQASVSDDEVERYYQSHLSGYERPARRRVRHILVRTRAQADELERKLRAGADFAALASRYSVDPATASAGGALAGGIVQGQTLPAFDRVAFSLKTNAISTAVHTPSGWEIIQPTSDVTPRTTTPLSSVRPTIEAVLLATKRENAVPEWVDETRAAYAKRVVYAPGFGPAT